MTQPATRWLVFGLQRGPAIALAALLIVAGSAALGHADQASDDLLMRSSGWGRFKAGAWQQVRVVVESLDAKGNVTSTTSTDKVTTVLRTAPEAVTLEMDISAEVAGKRFDAPLQFITQGCHGEPNGSVTTVRDLEPVTATIEGRDINCRVREFQIADKDQVRRVVVCYNREVSPYVLRRRCEITSADGAKKKVQSELEVIALDKPQKVLAKTMPASLVRTVQKTDSASITTEAAVVPDIPGGIVASTSQELDSQGRLVRRTKTEIVAWGLQSDDLDKAPKSRRDARRTRRHNK